MTEELLFFKKRLDELASRAYATGRYTYTDFLGLGEQDVLAQSLKDVEYAGLTTWGGCEEAERVVVRFGEANREEPWPFSCVHLCPLNEKFADCLTHRDVLGALMNLGICRETIGDIYLDGKHAYVFCLNTVLPILETELTRSKHTSLRCEVLEKLPDGVGNRKKRDTVLIASERADAVVAAIYKLSRSEASALFTDGKIYINGRQTLSCSFNMKENDVFSVRGFGRFVYSGVSGQSRKGRLYADVEIYV